MATENVRKIRVDDTLEMGYYIDDCTDPWKTPETIVMLTGNRKPRQLFYAWMPTLAREYRVLRPHVRGHWDSTPAPEGFQWSIDGLVRDVKHFLNAMGLEKVHMVGESLGGFMAYHFAYRYPERLRTLTVVTTPSPSFKQHRLGQMGSVEAHHPVWGADEHWKARLVEEFGPEHRELAEWVDREAWKSPVEATKGYFKAAAETEVDVKAFLSKINVPTLAMIGAEHTRIVSAQEVQRLCSLMPNAKLVTFPGVKAQCQFVMPERCAQEVLRFVKAHDTQRSE